ncbi:alpha/beta hydrolase [Catellatospora sp. NPDC049609]|uniref:alpha/beta fold hydrolase n=1 Tax=Catellatospora sp. NPDC049609 TaxID=3155505 RepID=UPI00341CB5C7
MAERIVRHDGLELWTEDFGNPADPALLLVVGASASAVHWPESMCRELAGQGLHVIRYDQRDSGQSSIVDYAAEPYDCRTLAGDALAVLDAYGIGAAHVWGASMGGLICQLLALEHRERVLTATLMCTASDLSAVPASLAGQETTFDPPCDPAYVAALTQMAVEAAASPPTTREELIELRRRNFRLLGGTRCDAEGLDRFIALDVDRARVPGRPDSHPLAVAATGPDLAPRLAALDLPVLVLHGDEDPIVPVAHGRRLAAAIPGARYVELKGWGHALPDRDVLRESVDAVLDLIGR